MDIWVSWEHLRLCFASIACSNTDHSDYNLDYLFGTHIITFQFLSFVSYSILADAISHSIVYAAVPQSIRIYLTVIQIELI